VAAKLQQDREKLVRMSRLLQMAAANKDAEAKHEREKLSEFLL
jgi:hypothetical protein